RWARATMVALAVIAIVQFVIVVGWMAYVRAQGGTRETYGTPLGLEREAMRAVCTRPQSRIVLRNETEMYRFPFEYLATTEPACAGKEVVVCSIRKGPLKKPCP